MQNTQIKIAHSILALSPVLAVPKPHVLTTSNECRQIFWPVSCAGPATKKNDRVVENASIAILIGTQTPKKMSQLLAEKTIVLGKLQLSILVARMGEIMVSPTEPEFQGKVSLIPIPSSRLSMKATERVMSASNAKAIRSNIFR